jgi:hypothetical protein
MQKPPFCLERPGASPVGLGGFLGGLSTKKPIWFFSLQSQPAPVNGIVAGFQIGGAEVEKYL